MREPFTSTMRPPPFLFFMETAEPAVKPRLAKYALVSLSPRTFVMVPESPAAAAARGMPPQTGAASGAATANP